MSGLLKHSPEVDTTLARSMAYDYLNKASRGFDRGILVLGIDWCIIFTLYNKSQFSILTQHVGTELCDMTFKQSILKEEVSIIPQPVVGASDTKKCITWTQARSTGSVLMSSVDYL